MPLTQLLTTLVAVGAASLAGYLALFLAHRALEQKHPLVDDVVSRIGRAAIALVAAGSAATTFGQRGEAGLRHVAVVAVILSAAWVVIAASGALGGAMASKLDLEVTDNRRARGRYTQLQVVRRVIVVASVLVALAAIALTFPSGRALGTSLLASAGVAGLVAGIAGRSTLGNLVAGLQIAFASPIRLDDVVVVEGQWGRIEEITLTYVVVHIWDQRRLVLPSSYFVETPFENWTRTRSELIGEVTLHLDHRAPLDDLRRVLDATCREDRRWDGRTCNLQVVDSGPSTMVVRCLVSARNASSAWDLRCHVREVLLTWLAARAPEGLPQVRTSEAPRADRPNPRTTRLVAVDSRR